MESVIWMSKKDNETDINVKNSDVEDLSIEQKFDKLEAIIDELEGDNVSLDKSFELYKSGLDLVADCEKKLDLIDKQVMELNDRGETKEFI